MHKWGSIGPMGLRAYGAIGDLGLSMFWSLEQTGHRTVGTKGLLEALGHMAYMGFRTFGVLCTFTMPYYAINRDTRSFERQFHTETMRLKCLNRSCLVL